MTELTEVVLQMRHRVDVFAGPLCGFFKRLRGHEIRYREVMDSFKEGRIQREIERVMPDLVFHPVSHLYQPWPKSKNFFRLSPADIENALLERDPDVYGVAREWLPFFKKTTGLRFPPAGRNDFLYRVYLSIRQKDTEGKVKKNVKNSVKAYGAKVINKAGMQDVLKGNATATVAGIDDAPKLLGKPQHQLEDYKKALDQSWKANWFDKKNNGQTPPPPKEHKPGHKNVRCPKCEAWLTSGPGTPCHKCGWTP